MGGPEYPFHDPVYERELPFLGSLLAAMYDEVRPFAQPARPPGLPYDFHWYGLMGYNDCGIRIVGAHPRHNRLLYNLGCNGVGFLPSIYGGHRVARILAGESPRPENLRPPLKKRGHGCPFLTKASLTIGRYHALQPGNFPHLTRPWLL